MQKTRYLLHHIEHLQELVEGKLRTSVLGDFYGSELLKLLKGHEKRADLSSDEIENAMRMIESIQYSVGGMASLSTLFNQAPPKFFYYDLKVKNLGVAKEVPAKSRFNRVCEPLSSESVVLLKGLHAALGLMLRFHPRSEDNQVSTPAIVEWQQSLVTEQQKTYKLAEKERASNINDLTRDLMLMRPNHSFEAKEASKVEIAQHIENFVNDYLRLHPEIERDSEYLKNVKKKLTVFFSTTLCSQDISDIFHDELRRCFDIEGNTLQQPLVLMGRKINSTWTIEDDKLIGRFYQESPYCDLVGTTYGYNPKLQELEIVEPVNSADDGFKKVPSFFEANLEVECVVNKGELEIRVLTLALNPKYAKNFHIVGKPEPVPVNQLELNVESAESGSSQPSATSPQKH